jgi:hypothetical protein
MAVRIKWYVITINSYGKRAESFSIELLYFSLTRRSKFHSVMNNFCAYSQINDTWETHWVKYNIPASTGSHQSPHFQEYRLRDLVPDSDYAATMRARNAYGDSEMSEEFRFRTAAGEMIAPSFNKCTN